MMVHKIALSVYDTYSVEKRHKIKSSVGFSKILIFIFLIFYDVSSYVNTIDEVHSRV